MKLYYEFKKILLSKDFWIITGIFFIMSFGLLLFEININSDIRIKHDNEFYKLIDNLEYYDYNGKNIYLNSKIKDVNRLFEIEEMLERGSSTVDLSTSDKALYFGYQDKLKHISLSNYNELLQVTQNDINNNYSYSNYIRGIKDDINNIKADSIWDTYSIHKKNSINKMLKVYSDLESISITENHTLTLDVIGNNKATDFMIIAYLVFVILSVYQSDENTKMSDIISASKVGYTHINILKLMTSVIIVLVATIAFYALFILGCSIRYGFVDLNSTIQSYNIFSSSPYALSVLQYYFLLIGYKALVYSMLVIVGAIFYNCISNRSIGLVLFSIIVIFSAYLYNNISENSYFHLLKYLNVFGLLQFNEMIKLFTFVELGLLSTMWLNISLLITLLSIVLCLPLYYFIISNRKMVTINYNFSEKWKLRKPKSVSLFFHEFYKLMVMNKSLLILFAGVFLLTSINNDIQKTKIYELEKATIELVNDYGGIKNTATQQFVIDTTDKYSKEKEQIDNVTTQFLNMEISEEAYNKIIQEYQAEHIERSVFQRFKELYETSDDYIVYQKPYNIIFSQYSAKSEIYMAFIIIIILILLLSNIYVIDKVNMEDNIYITTIKGRSIRRNKKILNTIVLVAILFIISFALQIFIVQQKYGLKSIGAPMSAVLDLGVNSEGFLKYPFLQSISIGVYILLLNLVRMIGLIFVSITCILISLLSKNRITAILYSSVIFIIPSVFHMIGFSFTKYFTVFDLIAGNVFIRQIYLYPKLLIVIFISIVFYGVIIKMTKE